MDEKKLKELIQRTKKGDAEAFGEIYESLKDDAYRFALYYLRDRHDAEDAVQSAALRAYVNIGSLAKPASFRSWFFTVEANVCRQMLRERGRRELASPEIEDAPDETAGDMFLSAELNEAMRSLSGRDRLIVRLSVVESFTSAEIADIVGLRPGSVRSSLSRSLHSLRLLLEKDGITQ